MEWIDTDTTLSSLCKGLQNSAHLAIDTEFARTSTYYPELCLVQLASEDTLALIDPFAIANLDALYELLYDPSTTKIFHSARQDLELFFHIKGQVPLPLFDTQIAASMLGHDEQTGYATLVKETLEVELEKSQTRTNWKRRPLSKRQLAYAADDVRYLVQLYEILLSRLDSSGQRALFNEKCQALAAPALYQPDPRQMWRKIKPARQLKGEPLAALKALAAWRELTARKENQPRKWLISDHSLMEIARSLPEALDELSRIEGISKHVLNNHGPALLETIAKCRQKP